MSINNKRSYTEYTVAQPTTDFAIGFDDFDEGGKDNVLVTLNGVLVESLGYAAIRKNESTVTITPAITEGTVRLTRETDIDEPFHKFTAGALFSAKSMDENFQQVRHSQQEVRDGFVFLEFNTSGIVSAAKSATNRANDAADVVEGLTDAVNDRVHAVEVSQEATVERVDNFIATDVVPIVNEAINNTAIEGGVLADTFVTATANGTGTVARTQRDVNSDTITPYDFGAIGDGKHHPISEKFATLALAKAQYPHVTSLTDSIDWAALQSLFNYCSVNQVKNVDLTINASINKTLTYLGQTPKTRRMQGHLKLTSTAEMQELIWLQGKMFTFYGILELQGFVTTGKVGLLNRMNKYGLRVGGEGVLNNSEHLYVHEVKANGFSQIGTFCDQNSMFVKFDTVIGKGCGSGWHDGMNSTGTMHYANYSNLLNANPTTSFTQFSTVVVDDLPPEIARHATNLLCEIGGELYTVRAVDRNTKTLRLYPTVDNTQPLSGKIAYHYGAAFHTSGNNSGCIRVHTVQAILCGAGFSGCSLYGSAHTNIITEYCGIGLIFGREYEAVIGYDVGNVYFETNNWDFISVWGTEYNYVRMPSSQGIVFSKVRSMYGYRDITSNTLRAFNTALPFGTELNYEGDLYQPEKVPYNEVHFSGNQVVKLTTPRRQVSYVTNSLNLSVSIDEAANRLFGYDSLNVTLLGTGVNSSAAVAVIAPNGWTVNGLKYFSYRNLNAAPTAKLIARFTNKDIRFAVDVGHSATTEPNSGFYAKGCIVANSGNGDHLGWRNTVTGFATNTAYLAGANVSLNAFIYHNDNAYRISKAGVLGDAPPTHITGITINGTAELEYVGNRCIFVIIPMPTPTNL